MFARIIVVVSRQKTSAAVDLRHILSFPVTEVPLSLAHSDGSPLKTEKSALLRLLETHLDTSISAKTVGATVIDEGLLLHTVLQYKSEFYGANARELLVYRRLFPHPKSNVMHRFLLSSSVILPSKLNKITAMSVPDALTIMIPSIVDTCICLLMFILKVFWLVSYHAL